MKYSRDIVIDGLKSGDENAISLAFKLAGISPCEKCGYIKEHCRCTKEQYCLGYTHEKCDNCLNQKNWEDINKLSDEDFQKAKLTMTRISDDQCRLLNLIFYVPIK